MTITIAPLKAGEEAEWITFLKTAERATLFHDPRFLAYHPSGRFRFGHLVARRDGELVAVIPGGLDGPDDEPIFVSPLGASVGGPAIAPNLRTNDLLELVAELQLHARRESWAGIDMVLPPSPYNQPQSDTLEFVLFFHGFRIANRWLCPMVPIAGASEELYLNLFRDTHANRVRAGKRNGMRVVQGGADHLEAFLSIFSDTYRRLGATPTHSPEEIADLLQRLPNQIRLCVVYKGESPAAGLLVFLLNERVAYTFYICMSDVHAREPGNVVAFAALIDSLGAQGYRWLDLGPTARPGNFHPGVTLFKEGLGGIGYCRDKWQWRATAAAAGGHDVWSQTSRVA